MIKTTKAEHILEIVHLQSFQGMWHAGAVLKVLYN